MTALGIRYLLNRALSSDMTRQGCEFPPHPGRVFMAMAAAHFETRGDDQERKALKWLEERATPPAISSPESWTRQSSNPRIPLESFVPVNDKHGGIVGRSRQSRSFPCVRLADEKVFLVWPDDAPDEVRAALSRLCSKVTRIGHSSSLVSMWIAEANEEIRPNITPDRFSSETSMRVAEPGTLKMLERAFANGDRPRLARWQGYVTVREEQQTTPLEGPFDPQLIVLSKEAEGRNLGLESTLQLTSALRHAAMKAVPEGECPEWLSGHQPNGRPTLEPHVAFVPLPFVGAAYADGHILGLAIAVPKDVRADEARRTLGGLLFDAETGAEKSIHLWRSDVWDWHFSGKLAIAHPLRCGPKPGPNRAPSGPALRPLFFTTTRRSTPTSMSNASSPKPSFPPDSRCLRRCE
jgi:CRISPR-associated protein Csb2